MFTKFTLSDPGAPSYSILGTAGTGKCLSKRADEQPFLSRLDEWRHRGRRLRQLHKPLPEREYTGGQSDSLDANGNFAGGGDIVHSNTTFDLHVAYNFIDGWFGGDEVYVDAKNLFDTDPPFYNFTNHDVAMSNGFNEFSSNPIGRVISLV